MSEILVMICDAIQKAVPASIAALTALYIARRVYPWQKERDRELKIAEEKRVAYQKFFDASEVFFAKLRTSVVSEEKKLPD